MAFLVCAWPGWLQGPPFGPRSWSVEQPVALVRGTKFIRSAHDKDLWPATTRTLHIGPDTASAFAWFCPEDRGLRDDEVVDQLLIAEDPRMARDRLRALGVSRVIVYPGDGGASAAMLARLLLEPSEWPLLHLTGGVAVFGWRDPTSGGAESLRNWEVDFDRLAFRPDESEVAPPARPADTRRWWDAFWKPAPSPRPPGRDEAIVLLRKAEALGQSAPFRHMTAWESAQAAGLIGAAGGWGLGTGPIDPLLRLTLLHPPLPDNAPVPAITQVVLKLQQLFSADRGAAPVGVVYAAIRAARRAVAENPDDANAHLVLGRAYVVLANTTAERSWAARHPQLLRVRQLQASAALNRAVELNPRLAQAHFDLAKLYLSGGYNCLDLAVLHLKTYPRPSPRAWGGPERGGEQAEAVSAGARTADANRWSGRNVSSPGNRHDTSVSDRRGDCGPARTGGQARDLLLKSDVAAFGVAGTELELDLLLRTGRPGVVLDWMREEERSGSRSTLSRTSGSDAGRSSRWETTMPPIASWPR